MDIEGKYAIFTPEEQLITGFEEKQEIQNIDVFTLYGKYKERQSDLHRRITADSNELLHYERAAILPDALQLMKDKQAIDIMASRLITARLELTGLDFDKEF